MIGHVHETVLERWRKSTEKSTFVQNDQFYSENNPNFLNLNKSDMNPDIFSDDFFSDTEITKTQIDAQRNFDFDLPSDVDLDSSTPFICTDEKVNNHSSN